MVLLLLDTAHVLGLPSVKGAEVFFGLTLSIREALADDHEGVQGGRKQVWWSLFGAQKQGQVY